MRADGELLVCEAGAGVAAGAKVFSILMIEIGDRIESNPGAPLAGQLELTFALRQKRRFSSKLRSGEEALVHLPRGVDLARRRFAAH